MNIGHKIREIRKGLGMKLIELSQKSGVQIATLSRMEHGKMTGTLESHMAIAKALDVDVTRLYSGITADESKIEVHGPRVPADVFVHSEKSSYEILATNVMSKKLMPVLLTVEAGGSSNKEENKPGTEKFIYVLEGRLKVLVGAETHILSAGASIYFDASLEHCILNTGRGKAKALCVVTPVAL